ncbi:rod shape-determining protein MreD [Parablastomonas sp. CN1-191]|uniref:rod shape-determining protein MreD n=1 Tax=Parablastomonas sp. CN1-191 TaxID=3400908 RepID=UPI003BF91626
MRAPLGLGANRRSINRAPSPVVALTMPWIMVIVASTLPLWPLFTEAPLLPPLGFMTLVAWAQYRPGLFPVWAGLPLGLVDDLYSGQPLGSAVLLWGLAMIAVDFAEARFPWRGFVQDWAGAAILIALYLVLAALIAGTAPSALALIAPQAVIAALLFPLVGRAVAVVDRWRLLRIKAL